MNNMWCRRRNVWPIFANQYCSFQPLLSDGVGSLLSASNLLSRERNQKLLCARCLTGTAWRDLVILLSPLLPQSFLFCLWVVSVFVYMWVFTEEKVLFFVLFFWFKDSTKSGGLVLWDISQYILLNSQSLLGKVSGENQNLFLLWWNSEIKTTLQNSWVISVVCRLVTQSIGQ